MTIHESLTTTEDARITIETTADVIKPVFAFGSKLVDEAKLQIDSSGLSYTAVDPANVAMIGLDVPAGAFETFDVDDTTLGVDMGDVNTALRAGRQSKGDEITLSVEGNRLSSTVQRDYDGTAMDLQNKVRLIDPDSIRQEPELPELDLPKSADIPRSLFRDVVEQVNAVSDHMAFRAEGAALTFDGGGDKMKAVVKDVVDGREVDVTSELSLDYVKDAKKAFAAIGADELTLHIGQEMPVRFEFETELNGETVNGWWFQAPRISDRD